MEYLDCCQQLYANLTLSKRHTRARTQHIGFEHPSPAYSHASVENSLRNNSKSRQLTQNAGAILQSSFAFSVVFYIVSIPIPDNDNKINGFRKFPLSLSVSATLSLFCVRSRILCMLAEEYGKPLETFATTFPKENSNGYFN